MNYIIIIMFFIDKYIPKNEEELIFHKNIYNILKIMSEDDSIPHIIFHGSSGTGKKTIHSPLILSKSGFKIHFS